MTSAFHSVGFACALAAGAVLFSAAANAQSVQKQCGDQWKAAKAAGTVPADQKWADYLKECRGRMAQGGAATAPATAPAATAPAATAPANPLKPAPTAPAAEAAKSPAVPTAAPAQGAATAAAPATGEKPKKPMSPGMAAFHAREVKCGEEWRTNTDQIKAQTPGITWPKYLSACNKRLKAAGQ
jgi:hypothetical protein